MPVTIAIDDEGLKRYIASKTRDRMVAVGERLVALCKEAVDKPSPPVSNPGEPPHRETRGRHPGFGQENILLDVEDSGSRPYVRVGVPIPRDENYMAMHEYGINYPKAGFQQRPWLKPTVETNIEALREVFLAEADE